MPTSTVTVKIEVLQWALDRSNKTIEDLLPRFPKIERWLSGADRPTLKQLEKLSSATTTPLGLLFLDKPPVESLPIPHFRTVADESVEQPSADLLDTIYTMQRRQQWMRDYLIEERQAPLSFVNSALPSETVHKIAEKIHGAFGLRVDWASENQTWTEALRRLRDAMEAIGILVAFNGIVGNNTHRKLNVDEFRGFVLVDEYAPLVFVNGADGKAAQMFTLAHEAAHIFLGSSAAFDLRQLMPASDKIERLCNLVAAEFLVPADTLKGVWPNVKNEYQPFHLLSRQFKVSPIVCARRALDLGMIEWPTFLRFYQAYRAAEHQRSEDAEGGDFYASQNVRIGRRLAKTIIRAVKEGKLLYSEAYTLTDLHGKTFDIFASKLA